MRAYTIVVPHFSNDRTLKYDARRFERELLKYAGGFTCLGDVKGAWRDDQGKVYHDALIHYEVAMDRGTKELVCKALRDLYPDQKYFYVVDTGEAELIEGLAA